MKSTTMETRVFGKWILAGEHAVLRGSPALVFPVFAKSLSLRFLDDGRPLRSEFNGAAGAELQLLFWGVVERGLAAVGKTRADVTGSLEIENSIPIGAGLGASAALCVAIGRWLAWKGWVASNEIAEFSRQLENLFHGESSGVDIAVAMSGKGLRFERSGARAELEPRWSPRWYISYSGKRGVTSECVAKVKKLFETDRSLAERIDLDMRAAVAQAEKALACDSESDGLPLLIDAIRLARTCFDRWGLAGGEMALHLAMLEAAGAAAVKPTGSGDGGYVLSVWDQAPPAELTSVLTPLGRV